MSTIKIGSPIEKKEITINPVRVFFNNNKVKKIMKGNEIIWLPQLLPLIPTMTSNTAPSGKASAIGEASGYHAYRAFDSNNTTFWVSNSGSTPVYLTYEFPSAVIAKKVNGNVTYNTGVTYVTSMTFKIRASNDGIDWTDLCQSKSFTFTSKNTAFEVESNNDNDKSYLYYQIYITNENCTGSSYKGHICSLQFYGFKY